MHVEAVNFLSLVLGACVIVAGRSSFPIGTLESILFSAFIGQRSMQVKFSVNSVNTENGHHVSVAFEFSCTKKESVIKL